LPVYVCPKCGRRVELPEGNYYCKVCGPSYLLKPLHSDPQAGRLDVMPLIERAQRKSSRVIYAKARELGVSVPPIIPVREIKVDRKYPLAMYNMPTKTIQISTSRLRGVLTEYMPKYGIAIYPLMEEVLIYTILHEFYHHVQYETGRYEVVEELARAGRREEAVAERFGLEEEAHRFARDTIETLGIEWDEIKYIVEKISEA
jgi:DNA-directed RNA polymerase subunit RPC12/RpoP